MDKKAGYCAVKELSVGSCYWGCEWSFTYLSVSVATDVISYHLWLQQNPGQFDILVPAYPRCPGNCCLTGRSFSYFSVLWCHWLGSRMVIQTVLFKINLWTVILSEFSRTCSGSW